MAISLGHLGSNSVIRTFTNKNEFKNEDQTIEWKLIIVLCTQMKSSSLMKYLTNLQATHPNSRIVGGIVDSSFSHRGIFITSNQKIICLSSGVVGMAIGELKKKDSNLLIKKQVLCKGFASRGCTPLGTPLEIEEMDENNYIHSFRYEEHSMASSAVYLRLLSKQSDPEIPLYLCIF